MSTIEASLASFGLNMATSRGTTARHQVRNLNKSFLFSVCFLKSEVLRSQTELETAMSSDNLVIT